MSPPVSANTGFADLGGRIVVDASVAIKWFIPEMHTDAARRLLREGVDLLAPDLVWAEVGNVLWRKWRNGELSSDAVHGILSDFRRFPLHIHAGESLYDATWPIARDSGRTFYDCLYLALAVSTDSSLVTADLCFFNALRDTPWARYCVWVQDIG